MARSLVVVLSGGIGGARLAFGLSRILPAADLLIAANTGDDFEHMGLSVCPAIDAGLYALAGLDDPAGGHGRRDDSLAVMQTLVTLGGADWWRLGDRDLALQVVRTGRLRAGHRLSDITADLASRLGVAPRVVPISDDTVQTRLRTEAGWIGLHGYAVRQSARPSVREVVFAGAMAATPHPDILAALANPRLRAVLVGPDNPFSSIDPLLAIPGMRASIAECPAPILAISPLGGRRTEQEPIARMLRDLGISPTAAGIARRYAHMLDGFILAQDDAAQIQGLPIRGFSAALDIDTTMACEALARMALETADSLAG
jgi:LPPG:FO 2-phospho-L-lactate transferase